MQEPSFAWVLRSAFNGVPMAEIPDEDKVFVRAFRLAIVMIAGHCTISMDLTKDDLAVLLVQFEEEEWKGYLSKNLFQILYVRIQHHVEVVKGGLTDDILSYLAYSSLVATLWRGRIQYPLDSIRAVGKAHLGFANDASQELKKKRKYDVSTNTGLSRPVPG